MSRVFLVGVLVSALATSASGEAMTFSPQQVIQGPTTVSQLPVCNAASTGAVYEVTDALLPALGIVVAGSGLVDVYVRCNGTSFVVK